MTNAPLYALIFLDFLVWSGQTKYKEVRGVLITNISEAKAQLSALIEKVIPHLCHLWLSTVSKLSHTWRSIYHTPLRAQKDI
ncbi:MAG: hypothetical protein U9N82_04400 [Thermodesulfobacteriota bacterium]|nr:hypothetical protein [Thermodesulfobacteriota bacterium]